MFAHACLFFFREALLQRFVGFRRAREAAPLVPELQLTSMAFLLKPRSQLGRLPFGLLGTRGRARSRVRQKDVRRWESGGDAFLFWGKLATRRRSARRMSAICQRSTSTDIAR